MFNLFVEDEPKNHRKMNYSEKINGLIAEFKNDVIGIHKKIKERIPPSIGIGGLAFSEEISSNAFGFFCIQDICDMNRVFIALMINGKAEITYQKYDGNAFKEDRKNELKDYNELESQIGKITNYLK